MKKDKLRSSGITVDQIYNTSDPSWYATVNFKGDGDLFMANRFDGTIYTKEPNSLPGAIDRIMEIAKGFGIKFQLWGKLPRLNYGDFKLNPPPEGWREMLQGEAGRIGFVSLYGSTKEAALSDFLLATETEEDFLDM
jgi:hypothetical protein